MSRRALGGPRPVRRPRASPEERPYPTEAQLDLLKAALLPAAVATPAWRRWKARGIPLEMVDEASGRLYSQLWANREAAAIGGEDLPLLKGVYRQALANNAVTLGRGLDMTQALQDAGIPVIFIKGAAMIAIARGRLGLRRTVDADVLVPEADAPRALSALLAAGCQFEPGWTLSPPPIGIRHAATLVGPDHTKLDLHWWAFKVPGDDAVVFDAAREAVLLGRPVLIPSTTDALIMAVCHGFHRAPASPLRWIADATLIFDVEGDAIDWNILLERAGRPGVTLALHRGLDFLARELGLPVPPVVLAELARRPVSLRERAAHWAACNDPRVGASVLSELELHRTRRLHCPEGVPWDFLGHLAQATGVRTGKRRDVLERHGVRLVTRLVRGESLLR